MWTPSKNVAPTGELPEHLRHLRRALRSLSSNRCLRSSISRRRFARVSNQIAGRVLGLVAGAVQVVQAIRQAGEGIGVDRRGLAWLEAARARRGRGPCPGSRSSSPPTTARCRGTSSAPRAGGVHLPEARLLAFQLRRLGPVAVDVLLDHRIPSRRAGSRSVRCATPPSYSGRLPGRIIKSLLSSFHSRWITFAISLSTPRVRWKPSMVVQSS